MKKLQLVVVIIACMKAVECNLPPYYPNSVIDVLKEKCLKERLYKCLMDLGKCDATQQERKSFLIENLKDSCEKCSPEKRADLKSFLRYIMRKFPDGWGNFILKYDPTGERMSKLMDF